MRYFIGNKEVKIQIIPNSKETQDETLDTFSFACLVDDKADNYEPNTSIYLKNDDLTSVELELMLVNDNVEIASFNPVKYLHTITAIQNTRKFSKQLIRNSVFSQPYIRLKESYNPVRYMATRIYNVSGIHWRCSTHTDINDPLVLTSHEKVENLCLRIDVIGVIATIGNTDDLGQGEWYYPKSVQQLINDGFIEQFAVRGCMVQYTAVGQSQPVNMQINAEDLGLDSWNDFRFGTNYKCPKLTSKIHEVGANNFKFIIESGYETSFVYGTQQPTRILTQMFMHLKIVAETYYNSALNVLNIVNHRQKQIYKVPSLDELGEYQVQKRNSLWDYETDLEELLDEVIPPNLTFTQLTAFECVSEVFRLLDATFTLSTDGKLDIEYFNDWDTKKYNVGDIKITGRNLAIGEDKYTNGLITYYQDGRAEVKTDYIPMRTRDVGVPNTNDFGIILPYPIQMVEKVFFRTTSMAFDTWLHNFNGQGEITGSCYISSMPSFDLDISFFVVEESMWSLLPDTTSGQQDEARVRYQYNTVYYSQNGNYITMSPTWKVYNIITRYNFEDLIQSAYKRFVGFDDNVRDVHGAVEGWNGNDFTQMFVKVQYTASTDGRTKIETLKNKYDGETLVDQYNGAVDLNKMGVNLLGLSLKMGEPTLSISQKICNWEDRIKKGEIYVYDNAYWIANVCSYQILPNNKVRTTVAFVKNFNALSMNTRLLREKRLSNVSSVLTQKSEDNIIEYIYYSTIRISDNKLPEEEPLAIKRTQLFNILAKSLGKNITTNKIHTALFSSNEMSGGDVVYLPMHKYGSGNCICFEMSFDSPMIAGLKTTKQNIGWFGSGYLTEAVYYTDDNGFFKYANISFVHDDSLPNSDFPLMDYHGTVVGEIMNYEVYKQPNEIFALNYEICFLPVNIQKDFIGERFITDNAFINDDFNFNGEKLYLVYSKDENFIYSQMDRKAYIGDNGGQVEITSVGVYSYSSTYKRIDFDYELINISGITSWCIARENGDILFASNNVIGSATSTSIYFFTRQKRI